MSGVNKTVLTSRVAIEEWKKIVCDEDQIAFSCYKRLVLRKNILKCLRYIYEYDYDTFKHVIRTCYYAILVAKGLYFSRSSTLILAEAALLHDVGKIAVPAYTINKDGELSDSEYLLVQSHVFEGCLILQKNDIDPRVIRVVLQHHEKGNGEGYPLGLLNSELSLLGKCLAVIDVFDALHSTRPYRKALSSEEVVRILVEDDGYNNLDIYLVDEIIREASTKCIP